MLSQDDVLNRIEAFNRRNGGGVFAEYRQGGYTLRSEGNGTPIARLKPTGSDDRIHVLYWTHRGKWSQVGPFGGTILSLDEALNFIAKESLFCILV